MNPTIAQALSRINPAVCCLLVILAVAFGCAQPKQYSYEAIKAEYGHPPVNANKAPEKPPEPKPLAGDLTLRSAVGRALAGNPDQEMTLARIGQSEALVDQAMAPFWPTLSMQAAYQRGDAPSAALFAALDQRSLDMTKSFNYPGTFQNYNLGLKANWNLYRGGRDLLQRRMAETGLEISRLDGQSVENALVASVIKAFYNSLAGRDFVAIAQESVKTVGAQLKNMRVRHAAGGALKSDVLSLQVRLAQAKENLVRARNNHKLALAALANLMGADMDAAYRPVQGAEPAMKTPETYRLGLAVALKLRPELQQARQRVVGARMALDKAKGGYHPTLDAQGRLYMDADTPGEFDTGKANWVGGLVLNWDVFTGLSTGAASRRARSQLREMLAADRKATQSVQLDVKTAYLNHQAALARGEVSAASVAQADESLTLVKRQYDGGAATVTRYLEAELALSQARIRAAASHYDQRKASADTTRSLGLWVRYAQQEVKRNAQKGR
jgi:outer membrane protein